MERINVERYRILVSVFSLSGYRYLGDSGTDQREILHDDTYWSWKDLLFWGGTPGSQNPKFWPSKAANISKTVSCSITCQLERNIRSTRAV